MDFSWADALKFGITTGLVAALGNQLFGLLREHLERQFRQQERKAVEQAQAVIREDERQHQALLRREAAHDSARDVYVPLAEDLYGWAEWVTSEAHIGEVGDFYPVGPKRTTLSGEADAIRVARRIAIGHPSRRVRRKAAQIADNLDSYYGEARPNGTSDPTFDEAHVWYEASKELVELIHAEEPES